MPPRLDRQQDHFDDQRAAQASANHAIPSVRSQIIQQQEQRV
ncbi:MAG: hypothetical protein ACK553_01565 [Planctomycetota bacterium]